MKVLKRAANARNFSQCDSLLMGDKCGAHTFPYIEVDNDTAMVEHEATTSKVGEDQIFYLNQRGIDTEDAVNLIVNGFCKEVFNELDYLKMKMNKLLSVQFYFYRDNNQNEIDLIIDHDGTLDVPRQLEDSFDNLQDLK